jgi:hypothetical protein
MTTFTTQDRQDAQRTPLSEEEIFHLAKKSGNEKQILLWELNPYEFARAIERAHGIGE